MFTLKNAHLSSNSYNFRMQPNIAMKFAGYVAWILLCKSCKFGKKHYYNSRDIEFFLGDYFSWRALYVILVCIGELKLCMAPVRLHKTSRRREKVGDLRLDAETFWAGPRPRHWALCPRRDVSTSWDGLETETSRPRPHPCVTQYENWQVYVSSLV